MSSMSSVYVHRLFLSSLILLHFSLSLSSPIFLPLSKHPLTNQHLTQIHHSSPLLLDLNSPLLWLNSFSNTSDESLLLRRSIHCSASGFGLDRSDDRCIFPVKNSITGQTALGQLVKTDIGLGSAFLLVFVPGLLTGLATSVKGVVGLGRNRVGVVEQVTHFYGLSKKFSICLSSSSSSNGLVLFGDNHQIEGFNSMIYTPILTNTDYYQINLKSLKVQNKKIELNQPSSVQISTIIPYSLMKTNIYKELITAFATATEAIGMIRVNPIAKFELCYNMKEINKAPVIDLVLQSEMVKWSIYGHNSMVKINNDVMCLGILDGGDELGASIVLGSHQLEDNLVEFDLGRSMIGFTSSLVVKRSSCSLLSSSLRKHVQPL